MNRRFLTFGSILLALALLLTALPMTALAAAPTSGTLTVTKTGSTFNIYKLASAESTGLDGITAYKYTAEAAFESFFTDDRALNESKIGKIVSKSSEAIALADALEDYIATNGIAPMTVSGSTTIASGQTIEGLFGYYLVIEASTDPNNLTIASRPMLIAVPQWVAGTKSWNATVEAELKDSDTDIEKKIVEGANLVDANTAKIGDLIPYVITVPIPAYDDNYDTAEFEFTITDVLSEGLTFNDATPGGWSDLVVKIDDIEVTTGFDKSTNPQGFTLEFEYDTIKDKSQIVVTFKAKLNEKAKQSAFDVINGNPNDVTLTYTNNPWTNEPGTKDDKVISYTTGISVKKIAADDIYGDLAGAEFVLHKDAADGTVVGGYYYDEEGNPHSNGTDGQVITDDNGMVYFPGLKEGTYYLVETVPPKDFHLLDAPVVIVITAETDADDKPTGAFTITVDGEAMNKEVGKTTATDDGKIFFNVTIENEHGWELPGTGGMGTTIFTIAGAALIVLGGILLVVLLKKRSAKSK